MSTTIEHDGFTIESNHESESAMRAAMDIPEPETHDETVEVHEPEPAGIVSEVPVSDGAVSAADQPGADSAASPRKAKPKENVQARINQALEKQRKAEERAAALEAEVSRLKQPAQPAEAPVQPKWQPVPGEKFATFDTWSAANPGTDYEDYIDARARHVYQAEHRAAQAQSELERLSTSHLTRVEVAKQKYPDYDQAVAAVDKQLFDAGLRSSDALTDAILRSDSSADLIYWLATHPEDALQLARESQGLPASAAPIVKRLLEVRLGAGERPGSGPTAELSHAKPPVRPVGVSSVVVPDEPGEDEPVEAYIRRQNALDRKRGRL